MALPSGLKNFIAGARESAYRQSRGALSDSVAALTPDIARFATLRDRHIADVNNTTAERGRLASSASSAAAQQFPPATSFSGGLRQALAGAKARTGVMARGEEAIKNQQLKDRLQIVRSGINKRGRGIQSLGQVANIREGVDVARQAASDFKSASNANLFGGLAGMGVGLAKNHFANRDPMMDKFNSGTLVDAPMTSPTDSFFFDINTPSPIINS